MSPEVMSTIEACLWGDLVVGDVVVCSNRDILPADLLLLATSAENGRAMVETSSLDGETNLKLRSVPSGYNCDF